MCAWRRLPKRPSAKMPSNFFCYQSEYGVLRAGARFDQESFHRHYEESPEPFKAELIAGVVSINPRVSPAHGLFGSMGVVGWDVPDKSPKGRMLFACHSDPWPR